MFERDGFHNARLSDVTRQANLATGTLYNYFQSKEELFRAVMQNVLDDLRAGSADQPTLHHADPIESISSANRSYVRGYRQNARLMTLLTEVSEADPQVREIGLAIRGHFEERISRAILRWQHDGLAWCDLDPVYTANALAYMVDRFLYEWETLHLDYDEDKVAVTLTKLWVRALGLADGPRRKPRNGTTRPGRQGDRSATA